jgi:hypothetical protein
MTIMNEISLYNMLSKHKFFVQRRGIYKLFENIYSHGQPQVTTACLFDGWFL